jgi:HEAT repeat protein
MGKQAGYANPVVGVSPKLRSALFLAAVVILSGSGSNAFGQDVAAYSSAIAAGNSEQKRDALFSLRNFATAEASRMAVPALRDTDPIVRATAAGSVIFLPPDEAATVLLPLLSDRDAFVRKEAAYALGRSRAQNSILQLVSTANRDRDLEVRAAAVAALGIIGDPAAVAPLTIILNARPNEENEFIRRSAARSIGMIAQILITGDSYVVTPENFLPERFKSAEGRDITVEHPAFSTAVATLSRVLTNRSEADDTRREAAFALGAIGSPSSQKLLEQHRSSPDPYLAEIVAEALLKIDKP